MYRGLPAENAAELLVYYYVGVSQATCSIFNDGVLYIVFLSSNFDLCSRKKSINTVPL